VHFRTLGFVFFGGLLWAGAASATTFNLTARFGTTNVASFGTVDVTEVAGGDLLFEISLNPAAFGGTADFHEFYFNLDDAITGAAITSPDVVQTAYTLASGSNPAGGAGSSFDFAVNFGNGAGPPGNGVLHGASFVLSASTDLAIADLLISSHVNTPLDVFFAAHVQGTALPGADSETVGAPVPEPSVLALAALGLVGLAGARRARRAAT
jgi:PEP-CTERM motif